MQRLTAKRVNGIKLKHRKPPEMPYWYWLDTDNCWRCKIETGALTAELLKGIEKSFFKKEVKNIYGRTKNEKSYD